MFQGHYQISVPLIYKTQTGGCIPGTANPNHNIDECVRGMSFSLIRGDTEKHGYTVGRGIEKIDTQALTQKATMCDTA